MSEERRLVTILFADVTGSTALGERLDPEDLRALLRRYYDIAREVVAEHGGTLEKFIGDAVMAVFGLPQAHGDDAARALATALALRDRVRADPRLGERLPIRLGVATGEVVASRDAVEGGDFLVTGDAVNLAARLQQTAEPWAVLVDDRSAAAAGPGFAFGRDESVAVKGRAAPVLARPLTGHGAVARRRTPLLGRDADLAQLELVAQRSFGERRPFLVSLVAPAGTGKTRLLEEFVDRLPSLQPDAAVTIAQCLPYGQRLTYWPLRSVLFRLVGLDDDSPVGDVRVAAERWLREAGAVDPERTAALLAASVGAADVEGIDPSAVFEAWRSAIEAAARQGPLVVVFEDLHWSSDALLDLVEFVLQPRGDLPLLLIVLTRPELLDRRPGWGGGRRNYLSLVLEPLPDDLVGRLVGHLLEGAPRPVVDAVVARADGNPFYAGELVRALVDRLGPQPDPAAIAPALVTLPDTVQAAVLARLDLLLPDARRVLQVGSIFGRAFRPAGVTALDPAVGDPAAACDELAERDLVRPASSGYAFRHILIREVAYATLPRAERARLHDAAGRWLEGTAAGGEDAYAELIAYHAREAAALARSLGLDEAERLAQRAVAWLTKAGDAAMSAAANVEALRHFRHGVELAAGPALMELQLRIGATRVDGRTSVEAYERALELSDAADVSDDLRLMTLTQLLELYTRMQGSVPHRPRPERLEQLYAQARALAERPGIAARARAWLHVVEGFRPFWYRGYTGGEPLTPEDVRAARGSAARGLETARELDDVRLLSAAMDAITSIDQDAGDFRGSRAIAEERIQMQERLPLDERIDAYAMSLWNSALLGDFAMADERARRILAQVQPRQMPNWLLHVRAWHAYALVLAGQWEEALDTVQRGEQLWLDMGSPAAGYAVRGFVAALDVAIARGDEDAREHWREIVRDIADQFESTTPLYRMRQAYARLDLEGMARELATPHTWMDSLDMHERAVSRLSDAGRPAGDGSLEAILGGDIYRQAVPLRAQVLRAIGLAGKDPERLRSALEMFDSVGAKPSAGRVRCELGLQIGDERLLQDGLAALEHLGDVERVAAYERAAR